MSERVGAGLRFPADSVCACLNREGQIDSIDSFLYRSRHPPHLLSIITRFSAQRKLSKSLSSNFVVK